MYARDELILADLVPVFFCLQPIPSAGRVRNITAFCLNENPVRSDPYSVEVQCDCVEVQWVCGGTVRLCRGTLRLFLSTVLMCWGTVRLCRGAVRVCGGIVRLCRGTLRLFLSTVLMCRQRCITVCQKHPSSSIICKLTDLRYFQEEKYSNIQHLWRQSDDSEGSAVLGAAFYTGMSRHVHHVYMASFDAVHLLKLA